MPVPVARPSVAAYVDSLATSQFADPNRDSDSEPETDLGRAQSVFARRYGGRMSYGSLGNTSASSTTRRSKIQTAIVFSDICGYTAMTSKSE